ncbi:MAG TPA: hypothetical protein VMI72_15390, partial [Roseiarcus sp.]|nr:hypothetical protein [Roseiarcus sp.]
QAHAVAGAGCFDDRRFSSSAPCAARVMIGTYVSSVAEIYLGPLFPSHRLDWCRRRSGWNLKVA